MRASSRILSLPSEDAQLDLIKEQENKIKTLRAKFRKLLLCSTTYSEGTPFRSVYDIGRALLHEIDDIQRSICRVIGVSDDIEEDLARYGFFQERERTFGTDYLSQAVSSPLISTEEKLLLIEEQKAFIQYLAEEVNRLDVEFGSAANSANFAYYVKRNQLFEVIRIKLGRLRAEEVDLKRAIDIREGRAPKTFYPSSDYSLFDLRLANEAPAFRSGELSAVLPLKIPNYERERIKRLPSLSVGHSSSYYGSGVSSSGSNWGPGAELDHLRNFTQIRGSSVYYHLSSSRAQKEVTNLQRLAQLTTDQNERADAESRIKSLQTEISSPGDSMREADSREHNLSVQLERDRSFNASLTGKFLDATLGAISRGPDREIPYGDWRVPKDYSKRLLKE